MGRAAAMMKARKPIRFIAAVPKELCSEARSHLPRSIQIISDGAMNLLSAADAAIVKTGTATLEAALADTPQVAVYDVSMIGRIEWCLLWAWRRIPFIAMPNIILQREAVPELIGLNCEPEKIASALIRILHNEVAREEMLRDYSLIRRALGSELMVAPTERTAQIAEEMLSEAVAIVEADPVKRRRAHNLQVEPATGIAV